jgi:nicotinic acid phosphoribosyltransferase
MPQKKGKPKSVKPKAKLSKSKLAAVRADSVRGAKDLKKVGAWFKKAGYSSQDIDRLLAVSSVSGIARSMERVEARIDSTRKADSTKAALKRKRLKKKK